MTRTSALAVAALSAAACGGNSTGLSTSIGSSGTMSTGTSGTVATSATSGTATTGTSSGISTSATSSGSTGTSTSGFVTAPHQPLPVIASQGGPIVSPVDVVSISYADVQMDLSGYADALLASGWFTTVGAEYGIAAGRHLADYVIPDGGPSAISDAEIQAFLEGLIDGGLVPPPTSSTVYTIEYPQETSITASPGETSCNVFGGYHGFDPNIAAVYAVIANCPPNESTQNGFASAAESVQFYSSHELMESATDPAITYSPGYTFSENSITALPWLLTANGELADLCVANGPVTLDAGLVATRIWSNAAADAGLSNPCVPTPAGEVYFNVSPALESDAGLTSAIAAALANQSTPQVFNFLLTGWSTAATADWQVGAEVLSASFVPSVSISNAPQGFATINNGETQVLTVTVPANTASQNYAGIEIFSTNGSYPNVMAVAVYVE